VEKFLSGRLLRIISQIGYEIYTLSHLQSWTKSLTFQGFFPSKKTHSRLVAQLDDFSHNLFHRIAPETWAILLLNCLFSSLVMYWRELVLGSFSQISKSGRWFLHRNSGKIKAITPRWCHSNPKIWEIKHRPKFRDRRFKFDSLFLRNRHQLYGKNHRIIIYSDHLRSIFYKVIRCARLANPERSPFRSISTERDSLQRKLPLRLPEVFCSLPVPLLRQWSPWRFMVLERGFWFAAPDTGVLSQILPSFD